LYQRLYHQPMPGEDGLSSRFDYLFEPLDDEGGTVTSIDDRLTGPPDESPTTAAPVRIAFAAFILGALGLAAVVAVLLLQRPTAPAIPVQAPLEPARLSTSAPTALSPSPAAPEATAAPESPAATQTVQSGPEQQLPQTQPLPTQSPTNREPGGAVVDTPATRAPISVAPETRQPFPNQTPRGGDGRNGGLLGGLL
jgi:hypothetical protein